MKSRSTLFLLILVCLAGCRTFKTTIGVEYSMPGPHATKVVATLTN